MDSAAELADNRSLTKRPTTLIDTQPLRHSKTMHSDYANNSSQQNKDRLNRSNQQIIEQINELDNENEFSCVQNPNEFDLKGVREAVGHRRFSPNFDIDDVQMKNECHGDGNQ